MVVFRRHYWQQYENHQDTTTTTTATTNATATTILRLFQNGADYAVQITRGGDDAQLSTLVPARWLIPAKQLRLSKDVLGGGNSGIVKKGPNPIPYTLTLSPKP